MNKVYVVVRYIQSKWRIVHAESYQSVFRSSVNSFENRQDAIKFAQDHGCEVLYYEYDPLQAHIAS